MHSIIQIRPGNQFFFRQTTRIRKELSHCFVVSLMENQIELWLSWGSTHWGDDGYVKIFSVLHTPLVISSILSDQDNFLKSGGEKFLSVATDVVMPQINLRLIRVLFVEYLVDFYWWCFGVMTRWKRERMVS